MYVSLCLSPNFQVLAKFQIVTHHAHLGHQLQATSDYLGELTSLEIKNFLNTLVKK